MSAALAFPANCHTRGGGLDEKVREVFAHYAQMSGHDTQELHVHLNASRRDECDFARGFAMAVDPDAPLNTEILHEAMIGQTAMVKIQNSEDLSDAYFTDRMYILEQVPEMSDRAARIGMFDADAGTDTATWSPVLGKNAYIGVYKTEKGHEVSYALGVCTQRTPIGYDLYETAREKGSDTTYAQFTDSSEYAAAQSLSRRNAQRLLYNLAQKLGVEIAGELDTHALRSPSAERAYLATLDVHNEFNTLQLRKWNDRNAAVVFDNAVNLQRARGGTLFQLSPLDGFQVMPFVCGDSARDEGVNVNWAISSFPVGMPRDGRALTARERQFIDAHYTWKGKGDGAPSYVQSVSYTPFNKQTDRAIFSNLYTSAYKDAAHYKPVAVRVAERP